jgi:hypothetical protein
MAKKKRPPPATRDHPRLIADHKCSECLFSPERIVSAAHAAQLLREITDKGGFFECHKGTIAGRTVMCHGSWRRHFTAQGRTLLQLCEVVQFVDPDNLPSSSKRNVRRRVPAPAKFNK